MVTKTNETSVYHNIADIGEILVIVNLSISKSLLSTDGTDKYD